MQSRETRVLFGKMDMDLDPRHIKTGDYIDARNIRSGISDTGADGTVENIKSTTQVTTLIDNLGITVTLPDGINKCIGTHTSERDRKSFMWIWNSEGDHTIWQYDFNLDRLTRLLLDKDWGTPADWAVLTNYSVGDTVTSTVDDNIYKCLYDAPSSTSAAFNEPSINQYWWEQLEPYLNFQENQLIYDVVEYERDGDTLLVWTDGYNEVKQINVNRLLRTSGDVYPDNYVPEYFELIPRTPQLSIPIYDQQSKDFINTDVSIANDYITLSQSQFRTGDAVKLTALFGNPVPVPLVDGTTYYAIRYLGSANSVQLATTKANALAGTQINLTSVAANSNFNLTFEGTTMSSHDSNKPNTLSGQYSQFRYQWEYMDGMKSAWSPISKVAVPAFSNETILGKYDFFRLRIPNRSNGGSTSYLKKIHVAVKIVGDSNTGDWYKFKTIDATATTNTSDDRLSDLQAIGENEGQQWYGYLGGGDQYPDYYELDYYGDEPSEPIDLQEMNNLFSWLPKKVRTLCMVGDNRLFVGNTTEGYDLTDFDYSDVTQTVKWLKRPEFDTDSLPSRSYKRGSNGKFGLIYSDDKGRVSSVLPFENEIEIPWWDSATMSDYQKGAFNNIQIDLDFEPPEWAKYYQIVTSKNRSYDVSNASNGTFLQIQIYDNGFEQYTNDSETTYTVQTGKLGYITDYNESYPNGGNIAVNYTFKEGDKIRALYAQTRTAAGSGEYVDGTDIYEGSIYGYDAAENKIIFSTQGGEYGGIAALKQGDWIEIYSPTVVNNDDESQIWYEFGETYRVVIDSNGDKAHAACTDRALAAVPYDQNSSSDANIVITGGDCWVYPRAVIHTVSPTSITTGTPPAAGLFIFDSYLDGHNFPLDQILTINPTDGASTLVTSPTWDGAKVQVSFGASYDIDDNKEFYMQIGGTGIDVTTAPTADTLKLTSYSKLGVESPYIEDFKACKCNSIGRPNIVTDEGLKEIHREATARIGQAYIPNTDINNIGNFYDIDFTEYNKNYGSIQKLYTDSHSVTLLQETKFGKVPISRSLIQDLSDQGLMGIISDLIGKVQYLEQEYGIGLNGESHVAYGDTQWWVDVNRNAVCELSGRGFRTISDLGMKFYFDQIFQIVSPYSNVVNIIGGYDKEFDEYLLSIDVRLQYSQMVNQAYSSSTFSFDFDLYGTKEYGAWFNGWEQQAVDDILLEVPPITTKAILRYYDSVDGYFKEDEGTVGSLLSPTASIIDLSTGLNIDLSAGNVAIATFRDVVAFSTKQSGWTTRYDFNIEGWSQHGNKLASVKDGKFWKHNDIDVSTYGTFHGTNYECYVEVPFNENPTDKKQALAIELETESDDWYMSSAVNNRGQETNIPNNLFKDREGDKFSYILRDTTTPNLSSPKTPLLDGHKIIGNYLKVTLSNASTSFANLFSTSLNWMKSGFR